MATKIQFRRDTTSNWENSNPVLSQGEPGLDLCRGLIKVGNGSDNWTGLAYQGTGVKGNGAVAIGVDAGRDSQCCEAVAIGYRGGETCQSCYAVAVGSYAGTLCQGYSSVAIGKSAATYNQHSGAVAIGRDAGNCNQGCCAVAVGRQAGYCGQDCNAVAVGYYSGRYNQSYGSVAIGTYAGTCGQGQGPWQNGGAVAIGDSAGNCSQQYYAVAVGKQSGNCSQGFSAVAVGRSAGYNNQGHGAVAVGKQSGYCGQGIDAVAIGNYAARYCQGDYSVAIGYEAAYGCCNSQGQYAVAIGAYAGYNYQNDYSIIINAQDENLNADNPGFFVSPIRELNGCCVSDGGKALHSVFYDADSKEVFRAPQMPQNFQDGNGDYTLTLSDAGKHIYKVGTGSVYIPTNASVAFPVGTVITLVTGSTNSTHIIPVDGGTTTLVLSKFGSDNNINVPVDTYVTILKVETEKWMVQT